MKQIDVNHMFHTDILRPGNAEHFIGRNDLMKRALNVLGSETGSCVIFGERGVGKSSLAWQIASTLENQNSIFRRSQLQSVGLDKEFVTVFLESDDPPRNVAQLLIQLLLFGRSPFSLRERFPKVFTEWDLDGELQKNFGVKFSEIHRLPDAGDLAFQVFGEVLRIIKIQYPRTHVVFFVDEVENMGDRRGLGSLVKRVDNAKFVLIGIADTLADIVEDHESAARKLIGGDLEVEPLNDKLIEQVFLEASRQSEGAVRFSKAFLLQAKRICVGFPWLAQHIGFHSVVIRLEARAQASQEIVVGLRELKPAIARVRSVHEEKVNRKVNYGELADDGARTIVRVIANSKRYLAVEDINKEVNGRMGDTNIYVKRLVEASILHKRRDGRYRFTSPIVRSFVLDEADARDGVQHPEDDYI